MYMFPVKIETYCAQSYIYIATFTLSNLPRIKENNSEVIIQFKIFYSGGKGRKFTSVFCSPPPTPPTSKLNQKLLRLPTLLNL